MTAAAALALDLALSPLGLFAAIGLALLLLAAILESDRP